jgi:hypothetical protein
MVVKQVGKKAAGKKRQLEEEPTAADLLEDERLDEEIASAQGARNILTEQIRELREMKRRRRQAKEEEDKAEEGEDKAEEEEEEEEDRPDLSDLIYDRSLQIWKRRTDLSDLEEFDDEEEGHAEEEMHVIDEILSLPKHNSEEEGHEEEEEEEEVHEDRFASERARFEKQFLARQKVNEEKYWARRWLDQEGDDKDIPIKYAPCRYHFKAREGCQKEKCPFSHCTIFLEEKYMGAIMNFAWERKKSRARQPRQLPPPPPPPPPMEKMEPKPPEKPPPKRLMPTQKMPPPKKTRSASSCEEVSLPTKAKAMPQNKLH